MEVDGDIYALEKGDRAIPDELRKVKNLKLRIWNKGFERFEDLVHFPNLSELVVMDYRLNSFKPLETLRGMRRLQIFHFPHVTNLEPLGLLSQLEELTLETLPGGDASGRTKIVKSFWPLASLRELRVLRLAGVRAEDEDLSPIGALKALQDLALGNFFPQRQFAMLATRLPKVRCFFLAPFLELEENVCRKCGGKKVLLSGADLPNPKVVCPVCQRKKFDASVASFERFMREQAESSGEPEPPISRDLKS